MKPTTAVRFVLTAALLVGVYSETGKWTAIAMGLTFAAIEIMNGGAWRVAASFERLVAAIERARGRA